MNERLLASASNIQPKNLRKTWKKGITAAAAVAVAGTLIYLKVRYANAVAEAHIA